MKSSDAIAACAALASAPRLALYRLLVRRGPQGFTPGELARRLRVPAPTLSFHLKALVSADLVASRREGRNLHYRPNIARMNALVAFLTANCCSLADGAPACAAVCPPVCASGGKAG
jgi:ArsR family transcriptional regulator